MKEIIITRRETLVLSPGERYSMPDNIVAQIVKRGSGRIPNAIDNAVPLIDEPKKSKKISSSV